MISELITAPVRTSANASPRHRWTSTHSLAEVDRYSFFVKDFHLLHHAGFRRRFRYVPYYDMPRLSDTSGILSLNSPGTTITFIEDREVIQTILKHLPHYPWDAYLQS